MLPVFVPMVQLKPLATLDVRVIPGLIPLQTLAVKMFVKTGIGFTVTVIVYAAPAQEPKVEVGVTK